MAVYLVERSAARDAGTTEWMKRAVRRIKHFCFLKHFWCGVIGHFLRVLLQWHAPFHLQFAHMCTQQMRTHAANAYDRFEAGEVGLPGVLVLESA